jgi:hypothetical protein
MLGDTYNSNNGKEKFSPTVYSDYKMSNIEGVDPSNLSFTYWKGMLKIAIAPMKKGTTGDNISFDHDNAISVYITHTKARILAEEIRLFMKDPHLYNNVGINTGSNGLITISNGKELGIDTPCLIIRKVSEVGNVEASYAYQFKTDYHFGIRNFDENKMGYDKQYYNQIEIDQFITLLEQYYTAMCGALAYSVVDSMQPGMARVTNKIESVMSKLGIDLNNNGYSGKSNTSFFNKGNSDKPQSSGRSFTPSTLDDISDEMGE